MAATSASGRMRRIVSRSQTITATRITQAPALPDCVPLQVLGAVAQLERALIAERTRSGLNAARARGRVGGNPGLSAGDASAIRKLREPRRRASGRRPGAAGHLLPTVRQMRPNQPWGDVVRVLNRGQATTWTVERLRRTVRRLADEGIIETSLLDRARPHSATLPAADRRPTRGNARAHAARRKRGRSASDWVGQHRSRCDGAFQPALGTRVAGAAPLASAQRRIGPAPQDQARGDRRRSRRGPGVTRLAGLRDDDADSHFVRS